MQQTVHLPGKLAYEKQLIKHHRREVKRFLINQNIYTNGGIATIMKFYDKSINHDNIILVHTHETHKFLQSLCTGKLDTLYTFTSSPNFQKA